MSHNPIMSTLDVKPLRVEYRVRNNRIRRAREELGISCKRASQLAKISYVGWLNLENAQQSPFTKKRGELSVTARKLSEFLGLGSEYLWSEDVLALRKTQAYKEVSMEEMQIEAPQERAVLAEQTRGEIDKALNELPFRLRNLLIQRWGLRGKQPKTLDEVAELMCLSRERVRQLEMRAMERIRKGGRLEEFALEQ